MIEARHAAAGALTWAGSVLDRRRAERRVYSTV